MTWTRSQTRNRNYSHGTSFSKTRPKTFRPWSDLNHDLLLLVMMKLGFGDFYSFHGSCKSWNLLANSNKNKFMESGPPMSITISTHSNKNVRCYLNDFEGRKFKTIISGGGKCIGVTCGYLIFFTKENHNRNFFLVNPLTTKELHFPHFPFWYDPTRPTGRAILVFSPSISAWVFVMICRGKILYSIAGNGAWENVSQSLYMIDIFAFKGKIYTIGSDSNSPVNDRFRLCELRLNANPQLIILKFKKHKSFCTNAFVSFGEKLYLMHCTSKDLNILLEVDVEKIEGANPCEKTLGEYAFFRSNLNRNVVAVKRESWADPRSRSHGRFALSGNTDEDGENILFNAKMWYFPHQCMNVSCIDD